VNFITARSLNKTKFENLLNSVNSGLVIYYSVLWLNHGKLLQRLIECLNEIKMFWDEQNQVHED